MGPGGLPVAMGDNSIRFVQAGINGAVWRAAMLPADGAPLPGDWNE